MVLSKFIVTVSVADDCRLFKFFMQLEFISFLVKAIVIQLEMKIF